MRNKVAFLPSLLPFLHLTSFTFLAFPPRVYYSFSKRQLLHSKTMRAAQSALRHVHPRKIPFSFGSCSSFSRTIYLHTRQLSSASASPFSQPHLDDTDDQQHYHSHHHHKEADMQRIKLVASRAQTPLSIAQCIKLGESLSTKSLLKNVTFLNRELPVRFSKRILELDNLPEELKKTEPFMNLAQNYSSSFQALQEYSDNSRLWYVDLRSLKCTRKRVN
jgi:hypothetical protein